MVAVGSFRNFALWVAAFDGGDHAAHGVDSLDVIPSAALDFVGQGLDKIRATERIDGIRDTGFVGDDLLRAESDRGRELGGERPSLIQRIRVKGLRAAEDGGQRLNSGAHDVVEGLLRRQRASRRLRMKTQRPGARILRFVALDHSFVPDAARRTVLGNLFEEIIVRVEEERKLRHKLVDIEAAPHPPFHILHAVA